MEDWTKMIRGHFADISDDAEFSGKEVKQLVNVIVEWGESEIERANRLCDLLFKAKEIQARRKE